MLEPLRLLRLRLGSRGRVRVSRSAHVGRGVRVQAARGARVVVHPGASLASGARISAAGGLVVVGPGARLGERSVVVSRVGVEIGASAVLGDWAVVSDVAPGFADVERPIRVQPVASERVVVGAGVVIGPHAAVGSSVADGSVVAPYAVV